MKKARKFLSVLFAMIFMLSLITMTASAEDDEYINNTAEINFENIDVYIADHTELILEPSDDIGLFEKIKTEKQIDDFSNYIENYSTTKSTLTEQLKTGDLLTVSYSETPLVDAGDHLEPLSSSLHTAEGERKNYGNFFFVTSVMRSGNANSAGEYLYTVSTSGEWTVNSILSGANYPSYGDDFVIQAIHSDMTYVDSDMLVLYDDGEYGGSSYYRLDDINDNYITYAVKDDPLGTKELTSFLLTATYYGTSKTYTRNIYSKYIHTWASVGIESIGIEFSYSLIGQVISVFPKIELEDTNKSWKTASNVAFNF